ncbi:MAG: sigma-70 family RNA polymerase sigma factor [Pseudomonadales bacterium]
MDQRLKSLAYRMLGSVADAEDIVQEALLRLHTTEPKPQSETAFLTRVVSNLSIDRLRRLKTEREAYPGPWLPEPWLDDDTAGLEQTEGLSIGLLHLMETLSPAERIVYVLHEAFDYRYAEIAELINITPASARQRAHRAKTKLSRDGLPGAAPAAEQQTLLNNLMHRITNGDVPGLVALLQEDAVAYTDGGGIVSAALIPVSGRDRIAQVSMHLMQKVSSEGAIEMSFIAVNGGAGLLIMQNGAPHSLISAAVENGRATNLYVLRNPDKLANAIQSKPKQANR